jgi:hypothetical protein
MDNNINEDDILAVMTMLQAELFRGLIESENGLNETAVIADHPEHGYLLGYKTDKFFHPVYNISEEQRQYLIEKGVEAFEYNV